MSCWGKYCCDLRGGSEVVFYLAHVEEYSHERNSVAMNLITPDEGLSVLDQHLSSIERQLVSIKHDLATLHEPILAGKIGSETHANKTMGSIKHWIRLAIEMEMKIADQKDSKPVSGAADMDSTSPRRGVRSGADWIASATVANRQAFLNDLTEGQL